MTIEILQPESEDDFEQIFRLNYKTFVEEIPQHEKRNDERLIDKFHDKNSYLVAKIDNKVLGMVCYNTVRPFSLDLKNVPIDEFIPEGTKTAELRLLAVDPKYRQNDIANSLIKELVRILVGKGIYLGFISATTRELDFYNKVGFTSFGELVGKEGAYYQPMYITFDRLRDKLK